MKKHLISLFALSALLLTGCGGNPETPTENPATEKAPTEKPATESPKTEAPATEEPKTEAPATEEPKTEAPATEEPITEAPVTDEPATETPVTESAEPEPEPEPELPDLIAYPDVFYNGGLEFNTEATMRKGVLTYWYGESASVDAQMDGEFVKLTYTAGTQWYATQIFYKGLYQEAGDSYTVMLTLNSSVSGSITLNGQVIDLVAGEDKVVAYDVSDANTLISMQLGVVGTSVLPSGVFKMKVDKIADKTENAVYHSVSFKNGEDILTTIPVKHGKTVLAPQDPVAPEGSFFSGWFEGELKYAADFAIEADHTFTAKFEEAASAHTVNFYNGDKLIGTANVADNDTVILPDLELPYGYSSGAWYTDAQKENRFDLATPVTSDLNLYATLNVTPFATFNGYAGWVPIDSSLQSNDENGGYHLSGLPATGDAAPFYYQVNFQVPVMESGKFYQISFDYKINGAGGNVQIHDGKTIDSASLTVNADYQTIGLVYEGGTVSGDAKLTFELSSVEASVSTIEFAIRSISLQEYVPSPELKAAATKTNMRIGDEASVVTLSASHFSSEVTYSATAETEGIVAITQADGVFQVAPVAEGETKVTFKAVAGEEQALAEITFTVQPALAEGENETVKPTSGKLEGAQFWLYGLDNSILGVTGENLSTIQADVKISITTTEDPVPEHYKPYIDGGAAPVVSTNTTWQAITADTVTFYCALDKGLDGSWNLDWTITCTITTPNGTFTIPAKFHQTTFVAE